MSNHHDHGRGDVRDNAIKALVTSDLFRSKVEKPKKGKGSYQRKARNQKGHQLKGDAPFDLRAFGTVKTKNGHKARFLMC
ncbi:ribosome alternative rescue factor ArfA [Shewanella amazonensis]|uniref:Alternative ribosome-rescue factor A n=1 Tax=Shewanella amazonensis (strain ATCC BAA-1098 / SB2B) TaxID=326297 RepID=A1S2T8_SHEAM|nr:hypothetical protein Sama_0484 [Shewanella amazonensis SB2B]